MISSDFVRVWNFTSNECRREDYGPSLIMYYTVIFLSFSFGLHKLFQRLPYVKKITSTIEISRIIFVLIIIFKFDISNPPGIEDMLYNSSYDAINFMTIVAAYYFCLGVLHFNILYLIIGGTLIQLTSNFNFAIIGVFNLLGLIDFYDPLMLGYIPIYSIISYWLHNANYNHLYISDVIAIVINHITLGLIITHNIMVI